MRGKNQGTGGLESRDARKQSRAGVRDDRGPEMMGPGRSIRAGRGGSRLVAAGTVCADSTGLSLQDELLTSESVCHADEGPINGPERCPATSVGRGGRRERGRGAENGDANHDGFRGSAGPAQGGGPRPPRGPPAGAGSVDGRRLPRAESIDRDRVWPARGPDPAGFGAKPAAGSKG